MGKKQHLSAMTLFSCTFGSVPMVSVPKRKNITMNGLQVMTTNDRDFVKSFGVCLSTGQPKPCSPKLTQWVNFEPTQSFKGGRALTNKSFIMCALGGKVSPQKVGQKVARVQSEDIICPLCGENALKHPFDFVGAGTNGGSSGILGTNILNGKLKENHKFYLENGVLKQADGSSEILTYKGNGIEAHHLICSEAMDDDEWSDLCYIFGYDINKKENGVFLPNNMKYACHLHLPLHKGGHEAGFGLGNMRYPESVKRLIDDLITKYENRPCDKKKWENFNNDLDNISKKIFGYVDKFTWWITHDGMHYQRGNPVGCSNGIIMKDKQKQRGAAKKEHNSNASVTKITIKSMKEIKQARNVAYQFMNVCDCDRYHKEFRGKSTKNILKISE